MARMRGRRSRRFTMPEVSLTPLIDTALTLLVIFMVAVPMVKNGIKVDLPEGKSREATDKQELIVSITKDSELFFNDTKVTKQELPAALQRAQKSKDTTVFVRADRVVSYGAVIDVVDSLKTAGVLRVAMPTRASERR